MNEWIYVTEMLTINIYIYIHIIQYFLCRSHEFMRPYMCNVFTKLQVRVYYIHVKCCINICSELKALL